MRTNGCAVGAGAPAPCQKDLTAANNPLVSNILAAQQSRLVPPNTRQRRDTSTARQMRGDDVYASLAYFAERRAGVALPLPRNAPDSFPRWVGSSQSAHESRTRLRESSGKPLAPVAELHTHHLKRCGKDPPPNCRPWRRWTKAAAAHSRLRSSNSARGIARSSRCVHEYPRRAPPGCPRAHVVGGSLSWALRRRPCSRRWSRRRAHGRKSGRRRARTSRRSALRRPLTRRGYRSCLGASSATNILR